MRESKLSGIYFHAAPTLISKQLEDAFMHKKGPGALPVKPSTKDVKAIIVPMYNYDIAGPCASWAYKALAESHIPDVVVIVSQSKSGESGITIEPYETPYGIVRVDQALARKIVDKGHIKINNPLFDDDESIESQLPFIQYIYKTKKDQLKILPIIISEDISLKELAVDLKEIFMDEKKSYAIVVPSNLTSFGRNHEYVPFSEEANKKVGELDSGAIDILKENKPLDFLKYVDEHGMNTTNYLGIVFAMILSKSKEVHLEQYYTSGEITNDYTNFISFAAIVIK